MRAILAWTVALGACGDLAGTDALLVAGSAAADGTGFAEVVPGADVELVPGSQGGFHVWIGVRVHGEAGLLLLEREARRDRDDALVLRGVAQAIEVPGDAVVGWWESPTASPAFMCPSPLGLQVYDEEIRFAIRLLDGAGQVLAEDELRLTPRCPTGDHHQFCLDICSG
jgi:hypothetical protein